MPDISTTTSPGTRVLDETDAEQEPPYHLVLLNDEAHSYPYVIQMLHDLFGYDPEKGFAIACMVDSQGRAIVMTDSKPKVEQKQDQIHSYGPDPHVLNSLGSMSAVVEAAE